VSQQNIHEPQHQSDHSPPCSRQTLPALPFFQPTLARLGPFSSRSLSTREGRPSLLDSSVRLSKGGEEGKDVGVGGKGGRSEEEVKRPGDGRSEVERSTEKMRRKDGGGQSELLRSGLVRLIFLLLLLANDPAGPFAGQQARHQRSDRTLLEHEPHLLERWICCARRANACPEEGEIEVLFSDDGGGRGGIGLDEFGVSEGGELIDKGDTQLAVAHEVDVAAEGEQVVKGGVSMDDQE
jgi:hypothetical protein